MQIQKFELDPNGANIFISFYLNGGKTIDLIFNT